MAAGSGCGSRRANTGQPCCAARAFMTCCSETAPILTSHWPIFPVPAERWISKAWRNCSAAISPCESKTSPSGKRLGLGVRRSLNAPALSRCRPTPSWKQSGEQYQFSSSQVPSCLAHHRCHRVGGRGQSGFAHLGSVAITVMGEELGSTERNERDIFIS